MRGALGGVMWEGCTGRGALGGVHWEGCCERGDMGLWEG